MSRSAIESAASAWIARRDVGLSAAEEKEFKQWLADPAHAKAFARHQKTWEIFDRPHAAGIGASLAEESRKRAAKRQRRRTIGSLSVVAILALGSLLWQMRPVSEVVSHGAVVVRPHQSVLPDGSVIDYKAGAQVVTEFTAEGSGERRVRLLKGEAHFQVAKNKDRPFIVEVGSVEVRAVGTAFTVERSESKIEVVVAEGKVAVDLRTGGAEAGVPTTVATLTAGERTFVELTPGPAPQVESLDARAVADRLAWRSTRLNFAATPLAEAVRLMNQFNEVQFQIADPSLGAVEVSGYFRAGNPDTFLLLLEEGFGVKGERQGNVVILRKAR